MGEQLVILRHVALLHPLLDQVLAGGELLGRRQHLAESAYESDAHALVVETVGVRTHLRPAPADVSVAVAAHQEVVANVGPVPALHVEHLYVAHVEDALGLGGAVLGGSVLYYDEGDRELQVVQLLHGGLRHPLQPGDQLQLRRE